MSIHSLKASPVMRISALVGIALFVPGEQLFAQSGPNPYRTVDNWAKLPDGRQMGAVGKVTIDPDGEHIWAVIRCDAAGPGRFGNECVDSQLDPVLKFDLDGNVVESFGGGMFIWPHGIDVDADGNVWVTDAVSSARIPEGDRRGHQVIKFSAEGEVLLTLGTPGIARDGEFIMAWGQTGYAPGEFRALHAIDIDSRGRVFVADRSNNRIQIFDQEGTHLTTWTQFGRPSGISFDENGQIFVADSESDDVQNPGWEMGIRIGDAETGWVTDFILYPWGDPRVTAGNGAEFVAVDRQGNIYGGEPRPRKLQKYVRVRQ